MSGRSTTSSLPALSGRPATCRAACRAAPQEIPPAMPSARASSRAVRKASSSVTGMTSSITLRSRTSGTKPAPMPWILCGPLAPPESTGEAAGSTPTTRTDGRRALSTWPTPVIVPPVPTPATKMSTRPSVSAQISSAVVRRCTSGLAGLRNCCSITAPGVAATICSARAMAPAMPSGPGGQHQLRPQQAHQAPPFDARRLRHGQDEPVALGGADEGQGDAGVAAGGLHQGRARQQPPVTLRRLDHGQADAVLHAGERVEGLDLGDDAGPSRRSHAGQLHQRGVARSSG